MKAFKSITVIVALCVSPALFAGDPGGVIISHFESLQRLSIQAVGPDAGGKLVPGSPVTVSFDALGRSFELRLEPNTALLSTISRDALPDGAGIFRGRLAGNPDSWARIVVSDGVPRGLVWDGAEMYAIEAPDDSLLQVSAPVIYRLADTYIEPGTMSCGTEFLSGNGARVYEALVAEVNAAAAQGPGAVSEINIGAVGDFEFTSGRGSDAAAALAISDRLNRVDGIYSREVGIQIRVPVIDTFSDPATPDPFSDTTDPSTLLGELANYRRNTPSQYDQGLTHLYTGRNLDGTTVGIAYSSESPGSVLCSRNSGAGLSEGNGSATLDSLIAAHEIGHNFGAPHDGETGSACEAEPQTFIMAPRVNGSEEFSPCSKAIIEANAAQAACVVPLPVVDVSIGLNGQSSTVLLGTTPSLAFEVSNNGTSPATGVAADITLPGNLTIDAVSASAGSCTTLTDTVNCVFGDVPGLTLRTVTVDTSAVSVGSGTITASVVADVDERASNNQLSLPLSVSPAVDLVLSSPSSVSVALDQSATIRATVDNRAVLDATGVSLSFSFGSGVRVDSASWSAGSCTVAAQQVDCQTGNFANQSSSTLNIGLTGLAAGAQGYSATIGSNEADADPANNNFSGTVTVNDPAATSSDGGAMGLPFLWLLGLAVLLTRRRKAVP